MVRFTYALKRCVCRTCGEDMQKADLRVTQVRGGGPAPARLLSAPQRHDTAEPEPCPAPAAHAQ